MHFHKVNYSNHPNTKKSLTICIISRKFRWPGSKTRADWFKELDLKSSLLVLVHMLNVEESEVYVCHLGTISGIIILRSKSARKVDHKILLILSVDLPTSIGGTPSPPNIPWSNPLITWSQTNQYILQQQQQCG